MYHCHHPEGDGPTGRTQGVNRGDQCWQSGERLLLTKDNQRMELGGAQIVQKRKGHKKKDQERL